MNEGCPECGFWQCGGCGNSSPSQVALEDLHEDLERQIEEDWEIQDEKSLQSNSKQ